MSFNRCFPGSCTDGAWPGARPFSLLDVEGAQKAKGAKVSKKKNQTMIFLKEVKILTPKYSQLLKAFSAVLKK
jgi:hypothetical protein